MGRAVQRLIAQRRWRRAGMLAVLAGFLSWCSPTFAAGLGVIEEAAFSGDRGMRVHLNDASAAYVQDTTPNALGEYHCKFWINLDNLSLPVGESLDVFCGLNASNQVQVSLVIRRTASGNQLDVGARVDSGITQFIASGNQVLVTGGWHSIEMAWRKATAPGSNNGTVTLSYDGTAVPGHAGLDTDQRQIDTVRFGFCASTLSESDLLGASVGTYDLDEFISRSNQIIGSKPVTTGIPDVNVFESVAETTLVLHDYFSDAETADNNLVYTTSVSDSALFTQVAVTPVTGVLTLTYEDDALGSSMITVRATDTNALYVETTFTVTVLPLPPDPATNPLPADAATGVALDTDLAWTADERATSHFVYFGTVNPPPLQGEQTETTFDTGTMTEGTTYFWRIDESNITETTEGAIWSFTTQSPPEKATVPVPANEETGVDIEPELSWTAGARAESHFVYFGTTDPPPLIGEQMETVYAPGELDEMTTYFWRVDASNSVATAEGDVWSFTTGTALLGDVNQDGMLDAVDVQLVVNAALGVVNNPNADVNGDSEVNAVDIQLVINAVLGV